MEGSGRNGDDAERPAGDGPAHVRLPLERSPEGRFVVRSSSHPPDEQTSGIDSSGVHNRPQTPEPTPVAVVVPQVERGRPGRSTPAERPRKRKELQQGGSYAASVRARCDTPRALPGTRISDRPGPASFRPPASRPAEEPSLPAIAALAAASSASGAGVEQARDEVTRRVRRPASSPPEQAPALHVAMSWRGLLAAGAMLALLLMAVWLFG